MYSEIDIIEALPKLSIDELRELEMELSISGGAFNLNRIRNWLSPRLGLNKKARTVLKKYYDWEIVSLQVYRKPLSNLLINTLNAVSMGKFKMGMKTYGFDQFFHLSLVATIQKDGKFVNVIMEKNEVVNISTGYYTADNVEAYNLTLKNTMSLGDLITKTLMRVGKDKFFKYDAFTNNCQFFITYLLDTMGLQAKEFIFQDTSELLKTLPKHVKPFARTVTDVAAVASKFIN